MDSDHPGVVAVLHFDGLRRTWLLCSGTLLSPRHVLTAAHCINSGGPTQVCFGQPAVSWGGSGVDCIDVVDCMSEPGYNASSSTPHACGEPPVGAGCRSHDLALLFLQRNVPPSWAATAPATLPHVTHHRLPTVSELATVAVGDTITQVGHGRGSPDPATAGTRRLRTNTISAFDVGPAVFAPTLEAMAPGDSGHPALASFSTPAPFGAPPIGVACTLTTVGSSRGIYNALTDPGHVAFIRDQMDKDGDGRVDYGRIRESDGFPVGCVDHGRNPVADPFNDPDGDGYLDASEDSLPGLYNPCGEGDRDGDTVPDDMDNCIDDPNPDRADRDGDGRGDACDNCVDTPNLDQSDRDGGDLMPPDGVGDVCDNCVDDFNPGQEDCDWNGAGDACDFPDTDMDGLHDNCEDTCRGVTDAPRPRTVGPDVDNCNYEAELVHGAPFRGDACDSVPCADFEMHRNRDEADLFPSPRETARVRVASIALFGLGHARTAMGAPIESTARTGFRWCNCGAATSDTAAARAACGITMPGGPPPACPIAEPDLYIASDDGNPWYRTSSLFLFDERDVGTHQGEVGPAATGPEFVIRYGEDPRLRAATVFGIWDWDRPSGGIEPFPPTGPGSVGRGLVWTFTRSHEPRTLLCNLLDPGCFRCEETGTCPVDPYGCAITPAGCPPIDTNLSSHYWAGQLTATTIPFRSGHPMEWVVLPRFPPEICPECAQSFPAAIIGRGCPGGACLRVANAPFDAAAAGPGRARPRAVPAGATDDMPLTPPVVSALPADIISKLARSDLSWLSASEPLAELLPDAIRHVAFDASGTRIESVLAYDGHRMVDLADGGILDVGAPLEGQARVLLGNRRALLSVGGLLDPVGGVAIPAISFTYLDRPGSVTVPIDGALPRAVEAAVVDRTGERVVILDRDPLAGGLRLLVLDLAAHVSLAVQSFLPALGEDFMLAPIPGGRFLMVSHDPRGFCPCPKGECPSICSRWHASTFGLGMDMTVTPALEGADWFLGRPLPGGVTASRVGITVVIDDPSHGPRPVGLRFSDMVAAGDVNRLVR